MGFLWAIIVATFICSMVSTNASENNNIDPKPQTFIISIQNDLKPSSFPTIEVWYNSILDTTTSPAPSPPHNILYIYKLAFHGFSATLNNHQTLLLQSHPAVISILPDPLYQTQTTRSPHFLGLQLTTPSNALISDQSSNVVIGMLDTGIWPERSSFRDDDMPPVPSHWKGECKGGPHFHCNKKLIGASYFNSGSFNSANETARDDIGHGTHTASTAAGRAVTNASLLGLAAGEARGIAPRARIAVYRVCYYRGGCTGSDILAGMDKAIEDGVDVLSISLGGDSRPYYNDPIAIAAFTAAERGVFVSAAAGNSGHEYGSVSNVAPWMTTVGAGTIDRRFPANIVLETGEVIHGVSLYSGGGDDEFYPLLYVGTTCSEEEALVRKAVRGKIVVCDRGGFLGQVQISMLVEKLGGVGVVVANMERHGEALLAGADVIPGVEIPYSSTKKLMSYLHSAKNIPKGKIVFRGTRLGVRPAPVVADFSSRGPNQESRYVLKPDVIAPGHSILAAWPDNVSVSSLLEGRMTEFNVLSGTSMACPHVSGIAALLKGVHPDWSPAMIRSALMTTANLQDRCGNPLLVEFNYEDSTIWDTGAGHVDPNKANDPGLVYDLRAGDYVEFMCASNYSEVEIGKIVKRKVSCSSSTMRMAWDLNYPAIVVYPDGIDAGLEEYLDVVVRRSVTNVGSTVPSIYNVRVINPKGANVTVVPPRLVFKSEGETQSFEVRITAKKEGTSLSWFEVGGLVWSDGIHNVNSPIVVGWR